jgi:hypothetical protein
MSKYILKNNDEKFEKYLENIEKYYKLKNKYNTLLEKAKNKILNSDISIENKKKLFSKSKPKCIACNKDGGTLFKESPDTLSVSCGNLSKPCGLNITIKRYKTKNLHNELINIDNELKEAKKDIMVTKLDYLFNYILEDFAVEKFEKIKDKLNKKQEIYNELVLLNNNVENEEFKNLINDKVMENYNYINDFKEIYNLYETTGENRYLVSALELYASKIHVLDEEILKMKYTINYIEKNNESNLNTLIQYTKTLSDLEISITDDDTYNITTETEDNEVDKDDTLDTQDKIGE